MPDWRKKERLTSGPHTGFSPLRCHVDMPRGWRGKKHEPKKDIGIIGGHAQRRETEEEMEELVPEIGSRIGPGKETSCPSGVVDAHLVLLHRVRI
uniref:Uncharacterized protein n=1 Tax=Oryza glaberrima TaxID=4538 RepID=A0A679BDB5_ORYGL|nr:hypothetical protein [Oryza glaberrima]BBF89488.1 hypothetical protein [Oryza glaberrima]